MALRRATREDAAAVAVLIDQLGYPSPCDAVQNRLEALLARPTDYLVAVAQHGGAIVGVIAAARGLHLEHDGTVGRITALSVAEGYRRQGVGACLLACAESWLRAHGASASIVNSHARRVDAHRFYQREGYAVNGVRLHKALAR
jgi:GNAT superfamily N-acetyltransferase